MKQDDFNVDDQDVLDNLKELDKFSTEDDLAELRRMINKTKHRISDYAFGVYNLSS